MRAPSSPAEAVTWAAQATYLPLTAGLAWAVGHGEYRAAVGWLVALLAAGVLPFLIRALDSGRDRPVTVVARGGPPTVHPTPLASVHTADEGYRPELPAVSGPDG